MVFKHSFKNKLIFSGIVDNAKMMNVAVGKIVLPDTRYLFDKLCNNRVEYILHAVCPECSGYAGIFEEATPTVECENCYFKFEAMNRSDACYFAIIDPSEAIRDLLQLYEDFYDYVMNRRKHDPNRMEDIRDGNLFMDFLKTLPKIDIKDKEETTVCKFINVKNNRFARTVKEIVNYGEDEELIPTSAIAKICIHIKIESKEYIIPSLNMLHY
ncbi:hypothetical protein QAD02_021768 [Eretmocerus hayati]|uniref:Uncharacterized protein n=1 Tax=Eretmocerus hayati TaxID=131215 RepID=A0ACC2PQU2_9HYME|nr:hypothetical protein QAD02_021768 [Eretmocerus hayati]